MFSPWSKIGNLKAYILLLQAPTRCKRNYSNIFVVFNVDSIQTQKIGFS